MLLDKNRMARSAAERLDAYRSCARVKIHKSRARYLCPQNIEKSFAQPVARRPQHLPFQAAQRPAPVFACDHAQGENLWNHGCKQINTDKENPKTFNIEKQNSVIVTSLIRGLSSALFSFCIDFSSSVSICVHPWFQWTHPTDAS